jgi:meso-butanediol dehydrogenase/(S,S)-butanediol dehydrogenase/diacetyl reductase
MGSRLEGKVILVTGGGSGIGEALCVGFADEGAGVIVTDIDGGRARLVAERIATDGGRAVPFQMDVTDREGVQRAIQGGVKEFGHLSGFFNNAGMNAPMRMIDVTEENFDAIMKVNAWGTLVGMQEAAKQFIKQESGGKIVNTVSIAGRTGFANVAPYCAAKSAAISLTQSGARSWAEFGITVNGFAPGVVDTPLWVDLDQALEDIGESDGKFQNLSKDIILGRPATPADILPTGIFLAACDSDYITGQIIPIDGGMILV